MKFHPTATQLSLTTWAIAAVLIGAAIGCLSLGERGDQDSLGTCYEARLALSTAATEAGLTPNAVQMYPDALVTSWCPDGVPPFQCHVYVVVVGAAAEERARELGFVTSGTCTIGAPGDDAAVTGSVWSKSVNVPAPASGEHADLSFPPDPDADLPVRVVEGNHD